MVPSARVTRSSARAAAIAAAAATPVSATRVQPGTLLQQPDTSDNKDLNPSMEETPNNEANANTMPSTLPLDTPRETTATAATTAPTEPTKPTATTSSSATTTSSSATTSPAASTATTTPTEAVSGRGKRKAKDQAVREKGDTSAKAKASPKRTKKNQDEGEPAETKPRKDSGFGLSMELDTAKVEKGGQEEQAHVSSSLPPLVSASSPTPSLLSLPSEMYTLIFSFLYLSELTKLATVSKTVYKLVESQPVWKAIREQHGLPEPKRKLPTEMTVVLAYSDLICEQCQSFSEMKRGRLCSDRPLPVSLIWNPHSKIHLCLKCRQDYFWERPEPLPKRPGQILKGAALRRYKLPSLDSLDYTTGISKQYRQEYYLFEEDDVQQKACECFGGMVGLEAERKGFVKPRHQKPRQGKPLVIHKPAKPAEPAAPEMSLRELVKANIRAPGETGNTNDDNTAQPGPATVVQIGQDMHAEPIAGLPREIWLKVISNLHMRNLVVLAGVSKALRELVEQLPIWKLIWTRARLPEPKSKGKSQTYMAVVCHFGESICELCMCYSYPSRGAPADRPLPIVTKKHKIWVCLSCRCKYLPSAKGKIGSTSTRKITRQDAKEEYALPSSELSMLDSCGRDPWEGGKVFWDDLVKAVALEYHGGHIGLKCALDEFYPKPRHRRPTPKKV